MCANWVWQHLVLSGWHCFFFSSYVVARDWSTFVRCVCDALQLWLYLYSGHCASMCIVDKCTLLPGLFFCCGPVAREQRVCFLQDRVKGKLLIGRSSGLCNNLLIQKLSWAVSGSVEQVTGLLHWGESIPHSLLALLPNTACFIRKKGPLV